MRRLSALESAGVDNTMLVQIALLAWVVPGEFPGLISLVEIATVSLGVFFTQVSARPAGHVPSRRRASDVVPSGPDRRSGRA